MSKKFLSLLLALVLLIGVIPAGAITVSAATSGSAGTDLTWEIKGDTLVIAGTGSVISNAGWIGAPEASAVKRVSIPKSVTEITVGDGFTAALPNCKEIQVESLAAWCEVNVHGYGIMYNRNLSQIPGKPILDLVIPNGVDDISGGSISGGSFNSITIPGTLKTVPAHAFEAISTLTSVTLKSGVETIGEGAFQSCPALTTVSMPGTVTTIEKNAFAHSAVSSIDLTGVKTLGNDAFMYSGLTSVTLPATLESFGTGVFSECSSLSSVTLHDKLVTIPSYTFAGCGALKSITIPASVQSIQTEAFAGTSLNDVRISDLDAWMHIDFAAGANPLIIAKTLRDTKGNDITKVTLPDETFLKPYVFEGCESLTEVTIPDVVKEIGENAFSGCKYLTKVNVRQETWDALTAGNIKSGNDALIDAYNKSHGGGAADPDIPALGEQKEVNGQLVKLLTQLLPFSDTSYETYSGSGKYLIGYGTPSAKDKTISKNDAAGMLHEYVKMSAHKVSEKAAALGVTADKDNQKFNALAAFTYINGTDWLNNTADPLYVAVKNNKTGSELINAMLQASRSKASSGMNTALCLANLYLNNAYSASVPGDYGVTYLDATGGNSVTTVIGYSVSETIKLGAEYDPQWINNGYEFVGWHTMKNAGSKVTVLDASTRNKTLYAHWQKKDSGVDGDTIVGNKVNYRIPAYLATKDSRVSDDFNAKVRVFANPVSGTATRAELANVKHINLVNANTVVKISAEYRTPNGKHLWAQISGSGWIDLGPDPHIAVVSGVVKQESKKFVPVYENKSSNEPDLTKTIGTGLRNGDPISVFARKTIKNKTYGHTVYFDANLNSWKSGWIDLAYAVLQQSVPEGETEQPLELLATGVVTNTDRVNVRANPRPDSTKVKTLPRGENVNIYGYSTYIGKGWCNTEHGWICTDYIDETKVDNKPAPDDKHEDTSGNVGSDDNTEALASGYVFNNMTLLVRKGPGNAYPKYPDSESLKQGARVHVYQTKMYNGVQWGRISPTESKWVCLSYVHLDDDVEIKNPEKPVVKLGQGVVYNCATGVNLRANASASSAFQGVLPVGTTVELLEELDKDGTTWYRTPKGFACGLYIKKIDTPINPPVPGTEAVKPGDFKTGIVAHNADVNVRNMAGVFGHAVVTTLKPGTSVRIYDETSVDGTPWYKIDQGWICAQYVQLGAANNLGGLGTTETTGGLNTTGTVLEKGLPILAGPGAGYKSNGKYNYGDVVTIVEQKLVDGVAYGRTDKGWVNLKFLSMNGTGITGTGTMGTIVKCAHSINVRSAAQGTAISTLRLGSRAEILETTDLGNGNVWGRTPLGWISMNYVEADGPIPDPNAPVEPKPTQPQKPETEKPKPSQDGTPFNMLGRSKSTGPSTIRIVPGVMGDYDAEIAANIDVKITKLVKVDNVVWGLIEGGWINVNDDVALSTWAVPTKAQIIWEDNRLDVKGALNKDTVVELKALDIDENHKVWGKITAPADGWIELTEITQLDGYTNSFMAKGAVAATGIVYAGVGTDTGAVNVDALAAGIKLSISGLDKDTSGNLWCSVSYQDPVTLETKTGWMPVSDITVNYTASVAAQALVVWTDSDMVTPSTTVKKLGDTVTVTELVLNSNHVPMGKTADGYVPLSSITANH